jgi:hypothetical protein
VKGGYTILSRRPNYKKLIEGGDNE